MDAPLRYPELFVADGSRTPRSYWTSLRYFNLYRIVVAALFFGITLVYGNALGLGAHALELFRYAALAYLAAAIGFHGVLRNVHGRFNVQLSLHMALDIVAITPCAARAGR